eukprot:scaffold44676_cov36-Prasinocladus_malaysianus.AAC.1
MELPGLSRVPKLLSLPCRSSPDSCWATRSMSPSSSCLLYLSLGLCWAPGRDLFRCLPGCCLFIVAKSEPGLFCWDFQTRPRLADGRSFEEAAGLLFVGAFEAGGDLCAEAKISQSCLVKTLTVMIGKVC